MTRETCHALCTFYVMNEAFKKNLYPLNTNDIYAPPKKAPENGTINLMPVSGTETKFDTTVA